MVGARNKLMWHVILVTTLTIKVITQICVKKESQRLKAPLLNYVPCAKGQTWEISKLKATALQNCVHTKADLQL